VTSVESSALKCRKPAWLLDFGLLGTASARAPWGRFFLDNVALEPQPRARFGATQYSCEVWKESAWSNYSTARGTLPEHVPAPMPGISRGLDYGTDEDVGCLG
jgi:hypothetical protein